MKNSGYTLLELLIIVAIIGIIGSVALPFVTDHVVPYLKFLFS